MRVLLVEDDLSTKKSIELMLGALGYDYDSVEMGEDGVDLARSTPYDLILLDIMLPGMDGYDVLAQLHDAGIDTPVLLQSGLVDRDIAVQGLSLGVDDYLIKPYSKVELAVRIESALHRACLRNLSRNPDLQAPGETPGETLGAVPGKPGPSEDASTPTTAEPAFEERRDSPRRNVLKSAQIVCVDANKVMDCTILNLSDRGAAIKPADPPYCPSSFTLMISNGVTHECEICWRYREKVGVRFRDV
jgi:CheY-like chemotaxis protein